MSWFARALKSPWKLQICRISLKSPWIFHRSPWIFLKAPWIQITFFLKKCFPQRNDWKHNNAQKFFRWSWKCFLYMILVFLAQFIFHYLKNPRNCEERYCYKQTPLHLRILKVFTSCYWGKEVLEKTICPWKVLDFFTKKFCMNHVSTRQWRIQTLR